MPFAAMSSFKGVAKGPVANVVQQRSQEGVLNADLIQQLVICPRSLLHDAYYPSRSREHAQAMSKA